MNKILGIFGLLIFVCLFTTVMSDSFVGGYNLYNITRWSALFGILSIGVAFVIITGGIDLSIGSVVCLIACLLPMLVVDQGMNPITACIIVMVIAGAIGLLHGLLITRMDLQPFVVTLCGLLFYRGFARWLTDDATLGFGQDYDGFRLLAIGKPCSWATLVFVGGSVLTVMGLVRAKRGRLPETADDHSPEKIADASRSAGPIQRWSLLAIGAFLVVVGASRFCQGWESGEGPVLFQIAGYQIRGLGIIIPDAAQALPSMVMKYLGGGLFVATLLPFLASAWAADARRLRWPLLAVAVSMVLLTLCVTFLVPPFRESSPNDQWRIGAIQMSGAALRVILMAVCFLVVGAAIGAIGWLLAVAGAASPRSKALIPLLVTGGVSLLLGFTQLPATMVPMPMLFMIALASVASLFLNQTVYGRYLFALGRNEEAARYSGINTKRMTVLAYVLCSLAAGLGGILFALDINSVQSAQFGNFWELYAIAAAVLGGCSLSGGEGNILGVVIGAAVMRVLYNAINILGISTKLEFAIIGLVILAGVIVDVLVKRMVARRAAMRIDTEKASPDTA